MKTTSETAAIPVLLFSAALKLALLDELLAASVSWRSLFKELVRETVAAIGVGRGNHLIGPSQEVDVLPQ